MPLQDIKEYEISPEKLDADNPIEIIAAMDGVMPECYLDISLGSIEFKACDRCKITYSKENGTLIIRGK